MHVFYIPPIKGNFIIHDVKYDIKSDELHIYVARYTDIIPMVAGMQSAETGITEQFVIREKYIRFMERACIYTPVISILDLRQIMLYDKYGPS